MTEAELTIAGQPQNEPSSVRLAGTLALAGMVSGLLLALVYQLTDPIIKDNQARELREAVTDVVPGATLVQGVLKAEGSEAYVVFAGYDENRNFIGYAIKAEEPGFADVIKLIYGYNPETKRVIGMKVLESLETPGLGDGIIKNEEFIAQFGELNFEPEIVVVKDGADEDYEIDALTGATISTKALATAINDACAAWIERLPADPPPYQEPEADEPAAEDGEGA
jgi:electron transport complex protein RnfG